MKTFFGFMKKLYVLCFLLLLLLVTKNIVHISAMVLLAIALLKTKG